VRALPDLQRGVRDALVLGHISGLEPLLVGGRDASKRLAIHQRHYHASLVTTLLDRFPATVWLAGSEFVTDGAREFVHEHPPSRPCIAEYGERFPAFLATRQGALEIPYLRQFGELEWHVSQVSISVDVPPVTRADFTTIDPATVADVRLTLQPGLRYVHADWAIDELMSLYLSNRAPDQFLLRPGDVWLETCGARGELRMNRLASSEYAFRVALAAGVSLADAAVSALVVDAAFDAGQALLRLVAERLVAGIDKDPC
jgi:hypothetical protein